MAKNTISSLLFQVCTIVCGFVIPRMILESNGSEVNGLVNSITQFLSFISILELGVGAVVISSLYKPLAAKNEAQISKIIHSASRFFKTIGFVLLVYVVFLMLFYQYIGEHQFDHLYSAMLILAMSISSFAQYYFGVVDRLLLLADQRGYIQYNAQTITLLLNTVACVALMKCGFSIHVVKLTTSIIYLCRPLALRIYVNRRYSINRKITYKEEPIKQKWNGVAQHICSVVLDSTDTMVLSVFSTFSYVSIYSVYFLVISGIKTLFVSLTYGIESYLGEMWAKKLDTSLREAFQWVEWVLHTSITVLFGCMACLIVPFVTIYTTGVADADYYQPVFAFLLVIAHASHCYRLPYQIMIRAAGHYKETQRSFVIATIINVVVSIVTVKYFGIIGVAIGTLVAMLYQTIWMAWYNSKNLILWPFVNFMRQFMIDVLTFISSYMICTWLGSTAGSYVVWVTVAIRTVVVWIVVVLAVNSILCKDRVYILVNLLRKKVKRGKNDIQQRRILRIFRGRQESSWQKNSSSGNK